MRRLVVAFGNPLMDATVRLEDDTLLKELGLESDMEAEVSAETLDALVKRSKVGSWRPGGAASNSLRLLALLGEDALLFGGVASSSSPLRPGLQEIEGLPGGRCVCLIVGSHRTLLANVGAAGHYSLEKLKNCERSQNALNSAVLIHVEAFFLSNRFPVCQYVAEELQKIEGKPLSYNLGSPYVIRDYPSESLYMAENADIVFGNEWTYDELAKVSGATGGEDCARKLFYEWFERDRGKTGEKYEIGRGEDRMGAYGKIVAVTKGSDPVLVFWGSREINERRFEVQQIDAELVVDTTGAGDAFLAGFVHALLDNRQIEHCVKFGNKLAAFSISYEGTEPPEGSILPKLQDVI